MIYEPYFLSRSLFLITSHTAERQERAMIPAYCKASFIVVRVLFICCGLFMDGCDKLLFLYSDANVLIKLAKSKKLTRNLDLVPKALYGFRELCAAS